MPLSTFLLAACLTAVGCKPVPAPVQPKTLLIGVDGIQLEPYESLGPGTTLSKRLHYGKAFTGGVIGQPSEQATLAGPGWMTVLTGVWANKHGVTSDDEKWRLAPGYPSLFERLRVANPNAYLSSVVSWPAINTAFLLREKNIVNVRESGLNDQQLIDRSVQILRDTPADFTFIQLGDPERVGQANGFGHRYQQALRAADLRIGYMLDEVEARSHRHPEEDWLVIVTTDHGRDETGRSHGQGSTPEKTIFFASNRAFDLQASEASAPRQHSNALYQFIPQTAIAPTVLRHMRVELQAQWHLDGAPLRER